MEQTLQEIVRLLNAVNTNIMEKLETMESRLARLEKMDSIEHRVTVNQIDITDIKELLERIEQSKSTNFVINHNEDDLNEITNDYIKNLNKRLDTQLLRVAKVEEALVILKDELNLS